jgi:3-methyl-2-oxobutanoate hydroxymethyltransferase
VPVLGHVGLTPQTASQLGGYKLQGKRPEEAGRILRGALALEAAGAYGVVLEMVPALLAKEITERLSVHTVGIGAGPHTDAQVLVFHDVVGLYKKKGVWGSYKAPHFNGGDTWTPPRPPLWDPYPK